MFWEYMIALFKTPSGQCHPNPSICPVLGSIDDRLIARSRYLLGVFPFFAGRGEGVNAPTFAAQVPFRNPSRINQAPERLGYRLADCGMIT